MWVEISEEMSFTQICFEQEKGREEEESIQTLHQ